MKDSFTLRTSPMTRDTRLRHKGRSSGALVLPGGRKNTSGLVVTAETVDSRLDETGRWSVVDHIYRRNCYAHETELGVLVLAVLLQVLADSDTLLDEEVYYS